MSIAEFCRQSFGKKYIRQGEERLGTIPYFYLGFVSTIGNSRLGTHFSRLVPKMSLI